VEWTRETKDDATWSSVCACAEGERESKRDFALYVDEFQNFATDSFESILSEARKYRLNLILANQFMTQLTDKIREAIIGNIGTVISGRIGITDAEILQKKFAPAFDAEDLTKLPNFQTITSVMINNVPSAAFSMSLLPPIGSSSPQLRDALKKLSAAKYGRPRAQVEKEIFARLGAGDVAKKEKLDAMRKAQQERANASRPGMPKANTPGAPSGNSSFLDDWLAKRQQIAATPPQSPPKTTIAAAVPSISTLDTTRSDEALGAQPDEIKTAIGDATPRPVASSEDKFHVRGDQAQDDEGVSIKLR